MLQAKPNLRIKKIRHEPKQGKLRLIVAKLFEILNKIYVQTLRIMKKKMENKSWLDGQRDKNTNSIHRNR